jgi:DNA-binding transcriptional MerR regulator
MQKTFRIGALADYTGRSVHAIRWYELQGLIPGVVRDSSGRRVYDELHLGWLELIDRLRRTGMSIAEMREYTVLVKEGDSTLQQRQKLLSAHRDRVRERISDWTSALKLIDSKVEFYEEWLTTGRRPNDFLLQRQKRTPRKRKINAGRVPALR